MRMKSRCTLIGLALLTLVVATACQAAGGPEAAARKAFEEYAQTAGTPYKDARLQTLSNDGTFAIVRITAKLRGSAEARWLEHEAEIECKKVGKQWQCEPWMYFRLTQTEQEKTVSATATAEAEAAATVEALGAKATATAGAVKAELRMLGKIAFASNRDNGHDIYVMNADGTGQVNLTSKGRAYDSSPTWSPDGTKIAFEREFEIYVMDADGSNWRRLTHNDATDERPAWSPDGNHIAFLSNQGFQSGIWVMNPDGSNQRRLTVCESAACGYVAWLPDGRLSFYRPRDIFIMEADGSDIRHFPIQHKLGWWAFSWSPDGKRIAFIPSNGDIYLMNADGTGEVNLTANVRGSHSYPTWSPDGKWIAFKCEQWGGLDDIYVIKIDGTQLINLSNSPDSYNYLSWSP